MIEGGSKDLAQKKLESFPLSLLQLLALQSLVVNKIFNSSIVQVGGHLVQPPNFKQCHVQGVGQENVQKSFEDLQGGRLYNLSRPPVLVLHHPHSKEVLSDVQMEPPALQFVPTEIEKSIYPHWLLYHKSIVPGFIFYLKLDILTYYDIMRERASHNFTEIFGSDCCRHNVNISKCNYLYLYIKFQSSP